MKNSILQSIDNQYMNDNAPEFAPGDDLRVRVKIVEGTNSRIQNFEGVCIARSNAGVGSSFTVRKISYGEGVERVFPLHSPMVDGIEVIRRGRVRRAKLYYLRVLRGKAARITEKVTKRPDGKVAGKGAKAKAAKVEAPKAAATEAPQENTEQK